MKTSTKLEQQGYNGVKVSSMLNACLSNEIKNHLRLVQIDELSAIKNKYFKLGYISKSEMTLLWNVYWNFVLNDYRFDDKEKHYTVITSTKIVLPQHIGLQMFNNLNK